MVDEQNDESNMMDWTTSTNSGPTAASSSCDEEIPVFKRHRYHHVNATSTATVKNSGEYVVVALEKVLGTQDLCEFDGSVPVVLELSVPLYSCGQASAAATASGTEESFKVSARVLSVERRDHSSSSVV